MWASGIRFPARYWRRGPASGSAASSTSRTCGTQCEPRTVEIIARVKPQARHSSRGAASMSCWGDSSSRSRARLSWMRTSSESRDSASCSAMLWSRESTSARRRSRRAISAVGRLAHSRSDSRSSPRRTCSRSRTAALTCPRDVSARSSSCRAARYASSTAERTSVSSVPVPTMLTSGPRTLVPTRDTVIPPWGDATGRWLRHAHGPRALALLAAPT